MRLLVSFVCFATSPAWAQTGSCSGGSGTTVLYGTVGLALPDSSMDSVQAQTIPFVFNGAECQCAANPNGDQPLLLDIYLTSAFPPGTLGTAQIWYGTNCDTDNLDRTLSSSLNCEQGPPVSFSSFVEGSSPAHIYIPIDAAALYSPKTHTCPAGEVSNGIYVLFFTGSNSNLSGTPYATCSLVQTELLQGPGAPRDLTVSSGDSAVTLSWGAPPVADPAPQYYQVLCADLDGNPGTSSPPANSYSTCTPDGLQRRLLPTGGTINPVGANDGGTNDGGTSGDGTNDGGTNDGGTMGPLPAPFTFFDRKFVCSDALPIGSGGGAVRISGLSNAKSYNFVVLAVDQFGNATPNTNGVVTATPKATPKATAATGCTVGATGVNGAWPMFAFLMLLMLLRAVGRLD